MYSRAAIDRRQTASGRLAVPSNRSSRPPFRPGPIVPSEPEALDRPEGQQGKADREGGIDHQVPLPGPTRRGYPRCPARGGLGPRCKSDVLVPSRNAAFDLIAEVHLPLAELTPMVHSNLRVAYPEVCCGILAGLCWLIAPRRTGGRPAIDGAVVARAAAGLDLGQALAADEYPSRFAPDGPVSCRCRRRGPSR